MSIPETCIRRPVMTTLVMAGLLLFGFFAYRALPVAELPNVDFPTLAVTARLPGANPETMAAGVATPLEKQFSRIAGVRAMTSVSSEGSTAITLEFELDRSIDAAALDVQSAISATMRQLPPEMPEPPSFRKVNPADFPIFFLSMKSLALPISKVNEYAENVISPRLSTIDGVAQLTIWGAQKYAVRVQVNPDALVTRGIGIDEVEKAIASANSFKPTGTLNGTDKAISTRTTGQIETAAGFNEQIIRYVNGAPVRIKDVAKAIDDVEDNKSSTWYGDVQGLMLVIFRQPGSNTVEIVNQINKAMPQLRAQVPASVELNVLYDRSISIREGIHDVQFTLGLAAGLVVLVIFLFLRSISATIIASIALPISIVGTFAVMWALGYSVNNLTLMALTLAVGFVVDDAIVMLENIVRHREKGLSAWDAAITGSKEIGFTIVSMTLSLIAVFIPLIFMQGMIGRLLHEFALTIVAAILVSGLVSLTLTPMLCSRFITSHSDGQHGRLYNLSERFFDAFLAGYKWTLDICMRHKVMVLASFFATIIASYFLLGMVQKDFLPEEDTGRLLVLTEAGQDASYEATRRAQAQVAKIVAADPNIDEVMSRIPGPSGIVNTGLIFARTKAPENRPDKDIRVAVQKLRAKVNSVPGIRAFVQNPPIIRVGGRLSNAQYQYSMQDVDLDSLYKWSGTMREEIAKLPGLMDVATDLKLQSPTVRMTINRDKAATLGVLPDQIEAMLASSFGSRRISTIYTASDQNAVMIEIDPAYQQDPNSLKKLYVRAPAVPASPGAPAQAARLIPLDALVDFKNEVSARTVSHQGQLPAVTISFNLAPEVALGTAIEQIRAIEQRLRMPETLSTSFAGTAQVFEASQKGMALLLVMAILVVYIVLGILYESFIHPLTILSGLPAAALGALLVLWYYNLPLTLYAFVGVIMLVGIVKKNAIMMIDFALSAQREHGWTPEKAIYEACLVRFRPIMMTTFAALAGALPIAMGYGQGGEARAPLGLTVVGGLLISQIITLYLTPVVYIYLDRLQSWGSSKGSGSETEMETKHGAPVKPAAEAAE
jgi:hydrophobic/amphiphilic exporter-1 (mainly G- bacteria), HAE1 family